MEQMIPFYFKSISYEWPGSFKQIYFAYLTRFLTTNKAKIFFFSIIPDMIIYSRISSMLSPLPIWMNDLLLILCFIGLPLFAISVFILLLCLLARNNLQKAGNVSSITFYTDYFSWQLPQFPTQNSSAKYSAVYQIIETETGYYLSLKSGSLLQLKTASLVRGTQKDFSIFLKSHCTELCADPFQDSSKGSLKFHTFTKSTPPFSTAVSAVVSSITCNTNHTDIMILATLATVTFYMIRWSGLGTGQYPSYHSYFVLLAELMAITLCRFWHHCLTQRRKQGKTLSGQAAARYFDKTSPHMSMEYYFYEAYFAKVLENHLLRLEYKNIECLFETTRYFFLIGQNLLHPIDKSLLTDEETDSLRDFLREKCSKEFKTLVTV